MQAKYANRPARRRLWRNVDDEYSLKLQELDNLRSQITGKTFPDGLETENEHMILKLAGGDIQKVGSLIDLSMAKYRKKHPGKNCPSTLSYFGPIFQQLAEADKARAAPPGKGIIRYQGPEKVAEKISELEEELQGRSKVFDLGKRRKRVKEWLDKRR